MIKKFNDFIIEELSYLSGHRQPLYHFTSALKMTESVEQSELLTNLETVLVDIIDPESPYKVDLPEPGVHKSSLVIEGKNEYNRQTSKWEREFDFEYIKTFLEPLDFYMKKEYDRVSYSISCLGYTTAGLDYNELIKEIGTRTAYKLIITGFKSPQKNKII